MKQLLIFCALTLGLSMACTPTGTEPDPVSKGLALTASQGVFVGESLDDQLASRATEASFQQGDNVGLFVHTTPTVAAAGNISTNVRYMATEAAAWRSVDEQAGALVAGSLATGYYPYQVGATDATAVVHSVATDQSSAYDATKAGALELSDFMISAPTAITEPATAPVAALVFEHKLAKLVVGVGVPNSIEGVEVVQVASVAIKNLQTKCLINLASGAVGSLSEVADITPRLVEGTGAAGAASKWEAIVVPQTVAEGTLLVRIVCTMKGGATKELSYSVPASDPLEVASGKKLSIMLSSSALVEVTKGIDPVDCLAHTGLEFGLTATKGAEWTLSSSKDWVTFSTDPASGYAVSLLGTGTGSEQIVYVAVSENPPTAARKAVLTLSDAYGATATYEVVQNGSYFSITKGVQLSDGAAHQGLELCLKTAEGMWWTLGSSADWVTFSTDPASGYTASLGDIGTGSEQIVYVSVAEHPTFAARTAVLRLNGGFGLTSTYQVVQPALHTLSLSLSNGSDWLNVNNLGGLRRTTVHTLGILNWTATVLDGDGNVSTDVAATPSTGGDGTSVQLTWSSNATNEARSNYTIKFALAGRPDVFAEIKTGQAAGPAEGLLLHGVVWAKGNLVSTKNTAGAAGAGGCKIGAPMDGGLYFQFGSLIGYKGGAAANDGSGVGSNPYTGRGTQGWNGLLSYSWANDAMVWPRELVGTKTVWTNTAAEYVSTLSDYYFNYSMVPWQMNGKNIRGFVGSLISTLASGDYAKWGVGDPCSYYLGGTWRLPTSVELAATTGNTGSRELPWTTRGATGRWAAAGETVEGVSGPGGWFGPGLSANTGTPSLSAHLFFPASGGRDGFSGLFSDVLLGFSWSSSICDATHGLHLAFCSGWMAPQYNFYRSYGFPVRCVRPVP